MENKKSATEKISRCWKPTEAKDYGKIPKFKVPQKRKVASTNKMLASTLLFVDLVKHKRLCDKVTVMPISTSNEIYVRAFGNSMAITRLINFMIGIGLISVANPNYRFNSKNPRHNKSREFYYFYENEVALMEYCETHEISVSHKSSGCASLFNRLGNGELDPDSVRFNSKLTIPKFAGYSKLGFEELLKFYLYLNYSQLDKSQCMF